MSQQHKSNIDDPQIPLKVPNQGNQGSKSDPKKIDNRTTATKDYSRNLPTNNNDSPTIASQRPGKSPIKKMKKEVRITSMEKHPKL